eukprot:TRINITY_DN5843_c0_g3_i3.p3 TRINITY_DN5843_c0_g3~~TRINITY_DN5843_c0_g3_i3.p3  ORF type:complete len:228 (+),score=-23.68 TRINITY_DN5843_c0_g3_i3:594-1277(+)
MIYFIKLTIFNQAKLAFRFKSVLNLLLDVYYQCKFTSNNLKTNKKIIIFNFLNQYQFQIKRPILDKQYQGQNSIKYNRLQLKSNALIIHTYQQTSMQNCLKSYQCKKISVPILLNITQNIQDDQTYQQCTIRIINTSYYNKPLSFSQTTSKLLDGKQTIKTDISYTACLTHSTQVYNILQSNHINKQQHSQSQVDTKFNIQYFYPSIYISRYVADISFVRKQIKQGS